MIKQNKKSFALLITLVLVAIFSYLVTFIYETKAISSTNTKNQYLYIQAKNHHDFLKEYINSLNLENINHIKIDDNSFFIEAFVIKEASTFKIDLIVKSKKENIRVVSSFIK